MVAGESHRTVPCEDVLMRTGVTDRSSKDLSAHFGLGIGFFWRSVMRVFCVQINGRKSFPEAALAIDYPPTWAAAAIFGRVVR